MEDTSHDVTVEPLDVVLASAAPMSLRVLKRTYIYNIYTRCGFNDNDGEKNILIAHYVPESILSKRIMVIFISNPQWHFQRLLFCNILPG